MMSKLKQVLVIIVTAAAHTACQEVPTETQVADAQFSSNRMLFEHTYDLTGSFFRFACDENGDPLPIDEGESIAVEGQVFERMMIVYNEGGYGYHFQINTMPVNLRGVGVTSGEQFRIIEREQLVANQRGDASSGSYHTTMKMVGETGRTFWMRFGGTYRLGSDGELVRERHTASVVCRA
jgi:hypothetical protein